MRSVLKTSIIVLLFFVPEIAFAHPFTNGIIETNLSVHGREMYLSTFISHNVQVASWDQGNVQDFYEKYFREKFVITEHGTACTFDLTSFDTPQNGTKTSFTGTYQCPDSVQTLQDLSITTALYDELFQGYQH